MVISSCNSEIEVIDLLNSDGSDCGQDTEESEVEIVAQSSASACNQAASTISRSLQQSNEREQNQKKDVCRYLDIEVEGRALKNLFSLF